MFKLINPIQQLIYISELCESVSEDDMLQIIKQAQEYNIKHEISGFLLSDNLNVLQLIEGSKKQVDTLFEKIKADSRHSKIQVLFKSKSRDRTMPFFGMGLCFINSMINLQHDFYYTRLQARELSGLIEGEVGSFFRKYII